MLIDEKSFEAHCEVFRSKSTRYHSCNTAKIAIINTKNTSIKNMLYLFFLFLLKPENINYFSKNILLFFTSNVLTFQ